MNFPRPADVLAQRGRVILDRDADGFADLFAPDGVIEIPFAPPNAPSRLAGQAAIREYSRHLMSSPLRIDGFEMTELHQTQDPEVVIAEVRAAATVTTTGQSFDATSIQVFRIRDGKILLFRDFANPRALEEVLHA
jgi:uncharacterized protein